MSNCTFLLCLTVPPLSCHGAPSSLLSLWLFGGKLVDIQYYNPTAVDASGRERASTLSLLFLLPTFWTIPTRWANDIVRLLRKERQYSKTQIPLQVAAAAGVNLQQAAMVLANRADLCGIFLYTLFFGLVCFRIQPFLVEWRSLSSTDMIKLCFHVCLGLSALLEIGKRCGCCVYKR